MVIYSNQQYKWQDVKHSNWTILCAFLGHSNLVQTMWFYHRVQLDCYKTQKKLLVNAKIFVANFGRWVLRHLLHKPNFITFLVIFFFGRWKEFWQNIPSLLKIFFATMKKFTTKKLLFSKHHVIVGPLVLKINKNFGYSLGS